MVPIKENFWNFQTRENRVICKVRKTQHQNSEFRHTQGEIFKKKLPKKYISIQWGKKPQKSINYGDKMSFFANTIERGDRGWKEAQRQGEDRVPLRITQILTKVKSTDGIVRQVICNKKSMQESLDAKLSQNCKVFNWIAIAISNWESYHNNLFFLLVQKLTKNTSLIQSILRTRTCQT